MRSGAVSLLRQLGWDVTVVLPGRGIAKPTVENNVVQIPFNQNRRTASILERLGLYEDSLDRWVEQSFDYLKAEVKKEDILFATSGGDLGTIKLASLLKREVGCKFVINFRDPLNYSVVNGRRVDGKFHVSREKQMAKYVANADLVVTSSQYYANVLRREYPGLKERIHNNYFGYIGQAELSGRKKEDDGILKIAYAGNMWRAQKPEVLYRAYERLKDKRGVQLYFIGNIAHNKTLQKIKASDPSVTFIDQMLHGEFLEFMAGHIDVGFVSLADEYFGACVPSKIYEYINLGLPMIGALPDGDAKEIINAKGYGIARDYRDIDGLAHAMERFRDRAFLEAARQKVLADREGWGMNVRIKELDALLKGLA